MKRRYFLTAALPLAACTDDDDHDIPGHFTGASPDRGHRLRAPHKATPPAKTHRTHTVIAGAGIAGLAAARALRQRGIEDFALLDLEDTAGGNSRPGSLEGIACPLGAHYLPVPTDHAREVQDLLEELGLRQRVAGRWQYDEHHLCHAPQERLWIQGQWQEGLLPLAGVGATALSQYVKFAREVERLRKTPAFRIPLATTAGLLPLDGLSFGQWLAEHGLTDAHLRWYLDYCCRDDYGAGVDTVSAWAGLHYFAARHGFHAPGSESADGEREALLTWPEGNGWLARRLAQPLGLRLHTGRLVTRIAEAKQGVEVDAVDIATGAVERWQAARCIVALPAFVAARVVENAPAALRNLAARTRYAPWVLVNLHLRAPLRPAPGVPRAWDNVLYGASGGGLGYVVATHQSLNPAPGPTVLSWYYAPGEAARQPLLDLPWTHWRDRVLEELQEPHPDLERQLTRVAVSRYGHAMATPVPGTLRARVPPPDGPRLRYAHADWAGYSIFEEAFTLGHRAGSKTT